MKHPAAFLLVILMLVYACKSEGVNPADFITLTEKQSVRTRNDITVTASSISDNRCPIYAQCLIRGFAIATVVVKKDTDSSVYNLWLGVRNSPSNGYTATDSVVVGYGNQRYKVILRDVTPYPIIGSSVARKAIIQVSRL